MAPSPAVNCVSVEMGHWPRLGAPTYLWLPGRAKLIYSHPCSEREEVGSWFGQGRHVPTSPTVAPELLPPSRVPAVFWFTKPGVVRVSVSVFSPQFHAR